MTSPKPKPDTYLIYPESNRTETTESPYMTGDSVEKQIHPVEPLEFNKDEKSSFDPEGRINNLHGLPGYSTGGTRRCRRRESMLKWIEDQTLTTGVHSEDTISATGFVDDEILGVKSNVIRQGDYREHPKDLSVSENDQTAKQGQTSKANKVHFDESKFCTKTIEYYSPSFDGVENPLRKVGLQRQMSVRSLNSKSSVYDTVCPDQKGIQSISTDSSENTDLLVKGRGMTLVGRTDRATQVLANEILQETKYLSFLCNFNIRRRKNCIKMPLKSDSRTDSLTRCFRPRSLSSDTSHEHLFEYRRRFIQGDRTNLGAFSDYGLDGQENHTDSVDFPMRQSTIDTIDSGIADETSMKSIQTSPYFADDEHRSLNRHQKLFRKPYRGNIFLDPKLVMSNSNRNSPCSDKGSDEHSFESSVERSNFEHGVSSRKSRRKASHKKDHNGDFTSLSDTEVTNASKAKFSISKYLSPTINKEKENISTEVPTSPSDIPETPKVPHTSKIGIWCTACSKDESINESKSSTDEPGDLYGLSTNSRNTLLDNLANFRNLVVSPFRGLDGGIGSEFSSPLNSPRFNSESNHSCGMNSQTTFSSEISRIIKPVLFSFTNASSVTRFDEIKPGHYVSSIENMFLPISVGSSKSGSGSSYLDVSSSSSSEQKSSLEKNLSVKSPDSRVSSPLSQGSKLGTLSDSSIFSDMEKDDDLSDRKLIIDKDDDSDDDDGECKAEGLGLTQGQVGVKNNFQVWVESSRNSSLSVTIHGPRPHTVLESSVVYTGDNLYEVVFEVSHPGYYVICLRWAGKEIQDSPYLCRVTY
ncbi:hypothetical protein FSP39_011938 [Pinctada imbricata]|uniref:Uncharacterized protein n=1 Tax=Pinctada imbricata TaxID=66713 RepID=A0AA88Y3H4_PINIB|nr:hypothetical protein FSP39_011938 [Pinctada imbricata]